MSDTVRESGFTGARTPTRGDPRSLHRMMFAILRYDSSKSSIEQQVACVQIVTGYSAAHKTVAELQAAAQIAGKAIHYWWQYLRHRQ